MSNLLNVTPLGFPWRTQDPFLFCAYHNDDYPEGNSDMGLDFKHLQGRHIGQDFSRKDGWSMYHGSSKPGFPYHPHRGFETITINKQGVVDHSDSLGASGRFMGGDVQWMTAGKGIQHSEMFPMIHTDQNNTLEIFQIWLNLPKASKMVEPHFKMLWKEDIPEIHHTDNSDKTTTIQVISGQINDTTSLPSTPNSWAADSEHAVGVYTVKMEVGAIWTLPKTNSKANRSLFFYQGDKIEIEEQSILNNSIINAKAGEDIMISNTGNSDAYYLILEGVPIGEPVVQHGPFVMNTQEEIRETMKEYGRTQFGGWPWAEKEVAHSKQRGRFAKHSDGREEIK